MRLNLTPQADYIDPAGRYGQTEAVRDRSIGTVIRPSSEAGEYRVVGIEVQEFRCAARPAAASGQKVFPRFGQRLRGSPRISGCRMPCCKVCA